MLEGLEISEVRLSTVVAGVETMRFDSEYHLKKFIAIDKYKERNSTRFCKFNDIGISIDCSAFYPGIEQFYDTGDNYLIRVQNIKNGIIDYESCATLPYLSSDYDTLKWVKEGDIVITKGGTIGYTGYVTKAALASRDLIFIKSSNPTVTPAFSKYLYLYFSTDFAFQQLIRSSSQCAQPHLTITLVKDFDILKASDSFINKTTRVYDKSIEKLEHSNTLYEVANNLLLQELGFENWKQNTEKVSVKSLKDSFCSSGRLDAEYYQPQYDEVERKIKCHNWATLQDLCLLINHGMQPPYVENGEMRVFSQKWIKDKEIDYSFIEDKEGPRTSMDFAEANPDYVCRKNDIVHYSVGANVGFCHTYLSDVPMMPGSFITLIRANENKVNPIYLGVVMNSIVGRLQSEKRKSGTAQPYVYPKDLKEFFIPVLPTNIQDSIAAKIQESFALRHESERLLDVAKKAVEIAISENEESAMKYIVENNCRNVAIENTFS